MQNKWIPTAKKVPDNMAFVWVTVEITGAFSSTKQGWYDRDQWRINSSLGYIPLAYNETVTAWMPIETSPEPYAIYPDRLNIVVCTSCVPFNGQHVAGCPKVTVCPPLHGPMGDDVRPALKKLKRDIENLCKCFCHTRDGLTICPDCEPVHNSRDYQLKCKNCGTERVYIRGQYPGQDNRLTCPQCTQERLDDMTATTGTAKWVPSPRNTGMGTDGFYDDCSICGKPMPSGNHPQCVAVMSGGAE